MSEVTLTAEARFAALEKRFAALEMRYNDLSEKPSASNEMLTGDATGANVPSSSSNPEGQSDIDGDTTIDPASTPRVRILISKIDKAGERTEQLQAAPDAPNPAIARAFTLRKLLYEDEADNDGEIDIEDPNLWELLKVLLGDHPYHTFRGPPVTLSSPYEAIVFNWDKLHEATRETPQNEPEKQARKDLQLLLDTLAKGSGDAKLDKYFKTRDSYKNQKVVSFETLWTIFPPGTLVYGRPFQGHDQVFIVQDNTGTWPAPSRQTMRWSILCWTYDWDGKMFKRLSLKLTFESFEGQKPVTTLPYFPLDHHEQASKIQHKLIDRGRIFREVCKTKQGSLMFGYHGEAIFDRRGFSGLQTDDENDDDTMSRSALDSDPWLRRFQFSRSRYPEPIAAQPNSSLVDGRVMVDFESYFRYGPVSARLGALLPNDDNEECRCVDCRENLKLRKKYRSEFDEKSAQCGDWDDEQYMLCPPRVLGYILSEKQWAQLDVESLTTIPKDDRSNSWASRLKLADGNDTKDMILNLVSGHGNIDPEAGDGGLEVDDIVAKKGKGLVILLYGPPGVGKTSTAETVAIAARKPLFSISVADVGTKAKKVEANLAKIFDLATSWQAILLIDEADVFLEARGKGLANNTERNALVSVFLRVLEYYQGILVLTTNQIAQFDVAVHSRIHIAIRYKDLSKDQTIAIFKGFLGPLAQKGRVKNYEEIVDWLEEDVWKMKFDGRQIRNIITSALNLARAQGKDKLDQRSIKSVLNNVKDFKDEFIRQYEKYRTDQKGMAE